MLQMILESGLNIADKVFDEIHFFLTPIELVLALSSG